MVEHLRHAVGVRRITVVIQRDDVLALAARESVIAGEHALIGRVADEVDMRKSLRDCFRGPILRCVVHHPHVPLILWQVRDGRQQRQRLQQTLAPIKRDNDVT